MTTILLIVAVYAGAQLWVARAASAYLAAAGATGRHLDVPSRFLAPIYLFALDRKIQREPEVDPRLEDLRREARRRLAAYPLIVVGGALIALVIEQAIPILGAPDEAALEKFFGVSIVVTLGLLSLLALRSIFRFGMVGAIKSMSRAVVSLLRRR